MAVIVYVLFVVAVAFISYGIGYWFGLRTQSKLNRVIVQYVNSVEPTLLTSKVMDDLVKQAIAEVSRG